MSKVNDMVKKLGIMGIKHTSGGMIDLKSKSKPKLPPAIAAPDPEATNAAKSRMAQRRKRSGRTSTVLTEGSNTLG